MNTIKEIAMLPLFDRFILHSKNGKRLKSGGKKIRESTIESYLALKISLSKFAIQKKFNLRIRNIDSKLKNEHKKEKKYWQTFLFEFKKFNYEVLNTFDNHLSSLLKTLKVFLRYVKDEKGIDAIQFFKKDYNISSESIPVIVLQPEQLNFLIYNNEFENSLNNTLKIIKDIFVIGCTVALRFQDLMSISKHNIQEFNGNFYLTINSNKTGAHTRIKLPEYAIDIIGKYKGKKNKLFPQFSNGYVNRKIKTLIERAGWIHPLPKTREKNGVPQRIYLDEGKKIDYRFCDHITCHTMRRTAITTMLLLGMNETLVRKISGHAPNSKEFYKYVSYTQKFFDNETDIVFDKLKSSTLN